MVPLLPPSSKPLHCVSQGFMSGWKLWWAASVVLTWVSPFLSLSVCLYPRLAFATLLCSRGRRNSHTRHQVETSSAPLYFPVLNKQLLPLFSYSFFPRIHWDSLIWRFCQIICCKLYFCNKKVYLLNFWYESFPTGNGLMWSYSLSSSHMCAGIALYNPAAHGVP